MKKLPSVLLVGLLLVGCGADKSDSANLESNASADAVVDEWAEWEANPEPYGGLKVLAEIKEAKEIGDSSLRLGGNLISDISPLKGLTNLEELWLGSNQITDISPLAGLTKLGLLELSYNKISDLSPLAGLTNLNELILDDNEITDVSPLAGLTELEYLWIVDNEITEEQKAMLKKTLPDCNIYF